jgi:fatty-acyl-CoA synthase
VATEDELLAFVCERVDEPPARPKRVTILDTLPLTNVGKIYKPDLRAMAAKAVAATSQGTGPEHRLTGMS